MAPTWVKRLRDAVTPSPPATIAPPEPDPDHEQKLAEASHQLEVADEQLKQARLITKPLADTARKLVSARDRNHFSEALERMIRQGYGHPRGENR